MNASKSEFQNLANKLTKLGESQEEFDFWIKIFDDLSETKQHELIETMLKELEELEKIPLTP